MHGQNSIVLVKHTLGIVVFLMCLKLLGSRGGEGRGGRIRLGTSIWTEKVSLSWIIKNLLNNLNGLNFNNIDNIRKML